MRIRTIKPEFWTDKRVGSWDHFTRLLFIGLWSAADDYGRGSAELERLASSLFPYDLSRDSRETLARVSEALSTLSESGRIVLYNADGERFFEVTHWTNHQKVDKPGKSRIPTPSEEDRQNSRHSRDTLASPRDTLAPVSGNREQGTGSVEQGKKKSTSVGDGEVVGEEGQAPTTTPTKPKLSDDEWLARLRANPAYQGINVDVELAKCRTWCETNNATPSRRRIVNWLNRARPVTAGPARPLNGFHGDPLATHPDRLTRDQLQGAQTMIRELESRAGRCAPEDEAERKRDLAAYQAKIDRHRATFAHFQLPATH